MRGSDNSTLRFVLITLGVLFAVAVVSALFALGPIPLVITIGALYVAFFIYGLRAKKPIVWLWLWIGMITGLVEVVSNCDFFLVEVEKVLIYPDTFPKIGVSPAYLPWAWGLVFTQLGLIGDWMRLRHSWPKAILMVAGLGGVLIAVFENLADPALWWYYQNTPMLIKAPYFVNIFEFLSTAGVVFVVWVIVRWAKHEPSRLAIAGWSLVAGAALGIWMCIAMRFAFWLLGPCEGAVIQLPCDS